MDSDSLLTRTLVEASAHLSPALAMILDTLLLMDPPLIPHRGRYPLEIEFIRRFYHKSQLRRSSRTASIGASPADYRLGLN